MRTNILCLLLSSDTKLIWGKSVFHMTKKVIELSSPNSFSVQISISDDVVYAL